MGLRAQTITADAEVEIRRDALQEFKPSPQVHSAGEVSFRYLLTSVLSSSKRAAKDAKAVKIRFNNAGMMSTQFILRSRTQRDQLFCESLVCALAGDSRLDRSTFTGSDDGSSKGMAANPYESVHTQGLGGDSTRYS